MLKLHVRNVAIAILMLCSTTLSGCLITTISFFHYVETAQYAGGSLQARANLANCLADSYTTNTGRYESSNVECRTALDTWELITRFVASGMPTANDGFARVFLDPVILQVPEELQLVSGAYQDGREAPSWGDILIDRTSSFSVTPTTEVQAEPGMVFYILDLPAAAFANLPYNPTLGPEFRFELGYELNSTATTLPIKAMLTARVEDAGRSYYLPMLPCTTDFASVPAVNVTLVDGEVQDLATAVATLLSSSSDLACEGQEYSFLPQEPNNCGNGIVDPSEECDGGQCCSPVCTFEPAATSCNDGDSCTMGDSCDGVGACVSDSISVACTCGNDSIDAGEECDGGSCCLDDCTLDTTSSGCTQEPEVIGVLENPADGGTYGGILVLSGWACNAQEITLEVDGGEWEIKAAYPTQRNDTLSVCGHSATGFGATWNYNLFGPGEHEIVAKADGVPHAHSTFEVQTPQSEPLGRVSSPLSSGESATSGLSISQFEFLRGASGTYELPNFPRAGETATVRWTESLQNFVLVDPDQEFDLEDDDASATGVLGVLENPQGGGSHSGISLLSGWHCDAKRISLVINGVTVEAGYGTERGDTEEICGDTNNGFGLTWNYGLLGPGVHRVEAYADGKRFGAASFFVATPGTSFLGIQTPKYLLEDFPARGVATAIAWQKATQSFLVMPHPSPSEEQRFIRVQPSEVN